MFHISANLVSEPNDRLLQPSVCTRTHRASAPTECVRLVSHTVKCETCQSRRAACNLSAPHSQCATRQTQRWRATRQTHRWCATRHPHRRCATRQPRRSECNSSVTQLARSASVIQAVCDESAMLAVCIESAMQAACNLSVTQLHGVQSAICAGGVW
jgi:hypothetical protein